MYKCGHDIHMHMVTVVCMQSLHTYVYSTLNNLLHIILLTLFTSHIVQCPCINSIILQMVCNGCNSVNIIAIMIVYPKPCILVLIEGYHQHFKARNNSFGKCKNGLCDTYTKI